VRVFVTGGTGHSGSHIVPELIARGHEVTGLARSDASAKTLSALGAKVRRGHLQDLEGLKDAAANSDGVMQRMGLDGYRRLRGRRKGSRGLA
jgi:uncharacterized protein YbjT (DUF2867 family)